METVKTNPNRYAPMFTHDGQFLCAECVRKNAKYIDDQIPDSWGCVGYCGDVIRVPGCGTPDEMLIVNEPEWSDTCAHCCGRARGAATPGPVSQTSEESER